MKMGKCSLGLPYLNKDFIIIIIIINDNLCYPTYNPPNSCYNSNLL